MNTSAPIIFRDAQADGYVRIPELAIPRLALRHLSSGLDTALLDNLWRTAINALSAGYTEWLCTGWIGGVADDIVQISVGWDWYQESTAGTLLLAGGDIRSNVMAVDCNGHDLGMMRTTLALDRGLAMLDWQCIVAAAVPLAFHPCGSCLN